MQTIMKQDRYAKRQQQARAALQLIGSTFVLLFSLLAALSGTANAHSAEFPIRMTGKTAHIETDDITLTVSVFPNVIVADGVSSAVVTGTVTHLKNGSGVPNATVTLQQVPDTTVIIKPSQSEKTDNHGNVVFTVSSHDKTDAHLLLTTNYGVNLFPPSQLFWLEFVDENTNSPDSVKVVADPSTLMWSSNSKAAITVTVTTQQNQSAGIQPVQLKALGGGVQPTEGETDAQGVFRATFTPSAPGAAIITATVKNRSASVTVLVNSAPVTSTVGSVTLAASRPSIPPDNSTVTILSATVKNRQGGLMPGERVTFTHSTGAVLPLTSVTNPQGVVTATFRASQPGAAYITATAGAGMSDNVLVWVADTTIPVTMTLTASRLAIPADSATASLITATVRSAGQPVAGRTVTFTVTGGSLKPLTGISNSRGEVTTTLTASGAGNAMVTAHPDVGTPVQRTITIDNMNLHLPLAWGAAPPPPPLVKLSNGDFETDGAWTQTPSGKIIVECSRFPGTVLGNGCDGTRMAWLGGSDVATIRSISQELALTKSYPVTVRFKFFIITLPSGCESDYFEVRIGSTQLRKIPLCGFTSDDWSTGSVELPAIDGKHELKFQVVAPGGVRSSIFIDDVSLCSTSSSKHPEMPACQ